MSDTDLWSLHGIMLGKIHLELILLIGVERAWGTGHLDNPPGNPQRAV